MILDLPPDHPVHVLSDAVHQVVVDQTPAGLVMSRLDAPQVAVDTDTPAGITATYTAATHRIALEPQPAHLVRTAELLGGRWTAAQEAAVHVLVHEHLHALASEVDAQAGTTSDRGLGEGAVDAAAADLTPVVVRRLSGRDSQTASTTGVYACVTGIRRASTVATRSRSWRDLGAVLWRLRLVMAPPTVRVAMLAATGTGPEVCR